MHELLLATLAIFIWYVKYVAEHHDPSSYSDDKCTKALELLEGEYDKLKKVWDEFQSDHWYS